MLNAQQGRLSKLLTQASTVEQALACFFGQNPVERVKKPGLLWIDDVMHNASNYLFYKRLHYT